MRKIIYICAVICCLSVFSFAQAKPFSEFDKAVREQKGGFSGDKSYLSKIFNQERIRLGDDFETQLWKYIGDDIEKHYWLNSFVEWDSYLHGNKPLPELAYRIRLSALNLLEKKNDKKNLGRKVTLNREQAIYYHNNGKRELALKSKNIAETILKEDKEISSYVAGMTALDRCIYSNLEGDTSSCEKESQKPTELIVASGYVNGIAVKLPQPRNPKSLKGEVHVRVLIGEDGKVISAEAMRGVKELFDLSVEAAKAAEFRPLTLSGKPAKRSGVIVYKFS
jgi:hypothetical protein